MCICSDRLAVQDCEMHYMNAWLKRCDLNRESVSEPRTLSGRLFQSLGARYEKVLGEGLNSNLLFFSVEVKSHLSHSLYRFPHNEGE